MDVIDNGPTIVDPIGDELVENPAVRRLNFTGSTRVGRIIAQTCAQHLKPAVLELATRLLDRGGTVLQRNFTTFVVEGDPPASVMLADGRRARVARSVCVRACVCACVRACVRA